MRRLLGSIALLLAFAGIGMAAVWWVYATPQGLRFAVAVGARVYPPLVVRAVEGSLRDGFTAQSLSLSGPTWSLQADNVVVEPYELHWLRRAFDFERVAASQVSVDFVPSGKPATPPPSLSLPVDLRVRELAIGELRYGERGGEAASITDIAAAIRLDADEIVVEQAALRFGASRVALSGRLDARSPFALQAQAQIALALREQPVGAQVRASGTLLDAFIELEADGADARMAGTARVTPFAPVPLAQLTADIAHFDPAAWFVGAPSMQLRGTVDLKPIDAAAGFSLAGPFALQNNDAGPIDRQRVPLRSVRGSLAWSADTLTLDVQRVEAGRGPGTRTGAGSAAGTLTWSAAGGTQARLTLSDIDLSSLHTRALPTRIDGQINYSAIDQLQRLSGTLRTDLAAGTKSIPLAADFNLTLRDQVLDVQSARLRIASGQAQLTGRAELRGAFAARAQGTFENLDLAQLVKGLDTRLNGRLDVDARFRPDVVGRAQLQLSDSRLLGRPLDGEAIVEVAGQRLDVDVDVTSRSARLSAQGGLGGGRELNFQLSAPQLAELLPDAAGSVSARGIVSGELAQPQIRLDAGAANLKYGGQSIESMTASIIAGAAPSAPLAVNIKLSGHRGPQPAASFAGATLTARGTTAGHTLELNASTLTEQPVRLIASGGWIPDSKFVDRQATDGTGGWRGWLVAAETGLPLELRLAEAAPLTLAPGRMSFGPARFEARGARFTAVQLQQGGGRWRTSGNFEGLVPQALDARAGPSRRATRAGADRQPLTLRGRWELDLAEMLTGVVVVERSSGDIYGGAGNVVPIGISDLGLALSVLNNRVTGTAYVRGSALGRLDAVIDAYLDTKGGVQLARERPFRIDIDALLPNLAWMGPLLGDGVQIEGSGSIKATVSGTPAEVTASGPIRASGLRLAYVEQGLRLENGTLDANLEDGVLVVNELVFTGSPRVAPGDSRADESVSFETPGRLRAVARIALRSLTGSVGIQADRLPVLQRRDRWMVVSGEGGITLAPQSAALYAKMRVDGAFIDFSDLRGVRSLPSDVVVVRTQQPTKSEIPAVAVSLDIQGDLGDRFYIRGAGLEARLDGALSISGRPGQLLAQGNVQTRGGTFQGYGQRLQIRRGIVTFQGPLDNPGLNVLALRQGLPVDVGVSIGGTAAQPIVRLYSDQSMTDVEKLNWLVLGRPPGGQDDGGQERALLSAAASALFSGQGDNASATIMRSLGVDEISLRPGQDSSSILPRETVAGTLRSASRSTAATDFVALGKRLNDDLYITLEQAVTGASTYVALNYQISRRLSLIARAGTTTALDLVYSIAFD